MTSFSTSTSRKRKANGAGELALPPWAASSGLHGGRRYLYDSEQQPLHTPLTISPDGLGSVLIRYEDRAGTIRHKTFPRSTALNAHEMIAELLDCGVGFTPRGIRALRMAMLSGT